MIVVCKEHGNSRSNPPRKDDLSILYLLVFAGLFPSLPFSLFKGLYFSFYALSLCIVSLFFCSLSLLTASIVPHANPNWPFTGTVNGTGNNCGGNGGCGGNGNGDGGDCDDDDGNDDGDDDDVPSCLPPQMWRPLHTPQCPLQKNTPITRGLCLAFILN